MSLTNPSVFKKPIGEFILAIYGDAAVPEAKRGEYDIALETAAQAQADELASKKNIPADMARASVDAHEGMPADVTPFMEVLAQKLPRDFFPGDLKNDALLLQAIGRVIHVIKGTLSHEGLAEPRIFDNDPEDLKKTQTAFTSVLKTRKGETAEIADSAALTTAMRQIGRFMATSKGKKLPKGFINELGALADLGHGGTPPQAGAAPKATI